MFNEHFNSIINSLCLEYLKNHYYLIDSIVVESTEDIFKKVAYVNLKPQNDMVCPICGSHVVRNGTYTRKFIHSKSASEPVILYENSYKYKCSNKDCKKQITQSQIIRANGKYTHEFIHLLINYMETMGVTYADAAKAFCIDEKTVKSLLNQCLSYIKPELPEIVGLDEKHFYTDKKAGKRGHPIFFTVLTDIANVRLLDVINSREVKPLTDYICKAYSKEEQEKVKYITLDFSGSYMQIAIKCFPNAKLVADYFHLKSILTKAIASRISTVKKSLYKYDLVSYRKQQGTLQYYHYWSYYMLSNYDYILQKPEEKQFKKIVVKGLFPNESYNGYSEYEWTNVEVIKRLLSIDDELTELYNALNILDIFKKTNFYKQAKETFTTLVPKYIIVNKMIDLVKEYMSKNLIQPFSNSNYEALNKFANTLTDHMDIIATSFISYKIDDRSYTDKDGIKHESYRYVTLNNSVTECINSKIENVLDASGKSYRDFESTRLLILLKVNKLSLISTFKYNLKY